MKILAKILATITGVKRYQVKAGVNFEWSSKSWTHNIFRVYELIFWRRFGIRAEMSSSTYNGGTLYICHTWESSFALFETKIRELFKGIVPKFKVVHVPIIATNNGFYLSRNPYLFAIAFDTASSATATGAGTSLSFSHTCTGSDLTLTVEPCVNMASSNLNPSGITYNSVAMTQAVNQGIAGNAASSSIWYLASPSTGSNSIAITTSNSGVIYSCAISLTGTDTTGPLGNTGNATSSSTTPSASVTTGTANSWVVDSVYLNDTIAHLSPTATGTNQTSRKTQDSYAAAGISMCASTETTTTTGSYTLSWSVSVSTLWGSVVAEIKAIASAPFVPPARIIRHR